MGGMWFRSREFGGILSERAGYKSGLALDEPRLREFLGEGGYAEVWPTDDTAMRVRSELFEEIFAFVLYKVGVGPERYEPAPLTGSWHATADDPAKRDLFEPVGEAYVAWLQSAVKDPATKVLDPRPFVDAMHSEHGVQGALLALDMVKRTTTRLTVSPWAMTRIEQWTDTRDLDELFTSESLEGPHGDYFDQRFVNFLAANFDAIDDMNWRQFEGLAAEYFAREGFAVELGPGRGDGGVDIRLWPDGARDGAPAAVLVQCKRQKTKVSNTVVKALWADIVAGEATSGLIVTTSSLAPSADLVRSARKYPIDDATRPKLRQWIDEMRSPGTGFFLDE